MSRCVCVCGKSVARLLPELRSLDSGKDWYVLDGIGTYLYMVCPTGELMCLYRVLDM
jgi:hypothetical protein